MFTADLSWTEPSIETVAERRQRKARQKLQAADHSKTAAACQAAAKSFSPFAIKHSSRRNAHGKEGLSCAIPTDATARGADSSASPISPALPAQSSDFLLAGSTPRRYPKNLGEDQFVSPVKEHSVGHGSASRCNSPGKSSAQPGGESPSTCMDLEIHPLHSDAVMNPRAGTSIQSCSTCGNSTYTTDVSILTDITYHSSPDTSKALSPLLSPVLQSPKAQEHSPPPAGSPRSPGTERGAQAPWRRDWEVTTILEQEANDPTPASNLAASLFNSPNRVSVDPRVPLACWQSYIEWMETAEPGIILARLKAKHSDLTNERFHQETGFDKQLWVLTGLRLLTREAMFSGELQSQEPIMCPNMAWEGAKVLSLYGSLASVCSLASTMPMNQLEHLSVATSTNTSEYLLGNIESLTVPQPPPSLPYASSSFSSIYAPLLPSAIPASAFPATLGECQRILAPTGHLFINVMDPCPVASTMGPVFRCWLEANLILGLERNFRCVHPSKLVLLWLADAGFVVQSSKVQLPAVQVATGRKQSNEELGVMVSRMLWMETWGSFVRTPGSGQRIMWWEDEEVVKECANLETQWEYETLVATRC